MKHEKLYYFIIFYLLFSVFYWCICQLFFGLNWLTLIVYIAAGTGSFIYYTKQRYKEIDLLSDYLSDLNHGLFHLDIEKYTEGDMSILRSELYKTMITLHEKNSMLIDQRAFLTKSLADIAHQLRNPMTAMMVLVDILENDKLESSKRDEFINALQEQLNRYRWLVNALLTMSKLDAKAIDFKRESINDQRLCQTVINGCIPLIEEKDISITLKCSDKPLICDVHWTQEAVFNIIKNALDHLPKYGQLTIISEVNPFVWVLRITDNGDGIDEDDLPHIFERYYRGKNATKDSAGIGLALSRSIMMQQFGNIEVVSKQQTTFIITLPQTVSGI